MASVSNRDRIDRALGILARVLEPFVARVAGKHVPDGTPWTALLEAKNPGNTYETEDVQSQLKIITEPMGQKGYLFNGELSRAEQNLASELRQVRNDWAHGRSFTADDAYRALDTTERLLRAINAVAAADEVRSLRLDVRGAAYAEEARRDQKSISRMPELATDLAPWREVLQPHPDVASGDYVSAEFAANLYEVANGDAGRDYSDPVEFFSRTYLTEGLQTLLALAARRIAGDPNAEPVINLQTTFGGGKTHSMLAAWHLFAGRPLSDYPQGVQDLLREQPAETFAREVKRVAIVGNELAPGQPWTKPDGTVIRTVWGELAWQLGGAEGYAYVADADRTSTNPGAALRDLIAAYAPALILIDEWVAYARGLYGQDELVGGTFETQFTFAQQLTEVVKSVPGALLLVSIPASDVRRDDEDPTASDLEVGGANGRAALERLQNVVSRVAYRWTPASSTESFEIVRRRLFREPDAAARAKIDATARRFVEFYRGQVGELPTETRDPNYEARIRAAYPIHPELFERLYGDWSTLERFQRTRGVLRLMSGVVHALYAAEDDSPLIMPGSMPLGVASVRDEVGGYLEDAWKAIIDRDIDGENATPLQIDRERPLFGNRALTRRIARALFMGSAATLQTTHKGIERQRIFLGVAMPGDTIGNFGSALQMLADRATYLYSDAQRYWFDRQPSLNRTVAERAENLPIADVWEAVVARLKQEPRSTPEFAEVLFAPENSADVVESDKLRLVLAHPRFVHDGKGKDSPARDHAQELVTRRGAAPRENANTLVVLAPDDARWDELEQAVRQQLAWAQVAKSAREMELLPSQADLAHKKADEYNTIVAQRLRGTWIWALYPEQQNGAEPLRIAAAKHDGASDSLVQFLGPRLRNNDIVQTQISPLAISIELRSHLRSRWNSGRISVGELWGYHVKYPYLARLRDKSVLVDAIERVMIDPGWSQGGFALADGYDEASGEFRGLRFPIEDPAPAIADATLLVEPALAERNRPAQLLPPGGEGTGDEGPGEGYAPGPGQVPGGTLPHPPISGPLEIVENARYRAIVDIKPSGDMRDQLTQVVDEVLAHLQSAGADTLEVRLTVDAGKRDGFAPETVRVVKENGATLGFVENRFREL